MSLPIYQTSSKDLSLLQTTWANQLNPVIQNPANQGLILQNVQLAVGSNTINHKLGRNLQGWQISRQRGPANIYDNQDANNLPALTLILVSDAAVSVNIEVW